MTEPSNSQFNFKSKASQSGARPYSRSNWFANWGRKQRWMLGLILSLGCLLGSLGVNIWAETPAPLSTVHWSPGVEWIAPATPRYRFYARTTFDAPETIQAAWLRVSADNDFVLHVNGRQSVVRENGALNAPKGLAYRRKVLSQSFSDVIPYEARTGLNYLMASSPDWRLPVYVDITSYLEPGENAIAIEVQKGHPSARLALEGQVILAGDLPTIDFSTGKAPWKVSNLAENKLALRWFHRQFDDHTWELAQTRGPIREQTYSRLSQQLFTRPVSGQWITAPIENANIEALALTASEGSQPSLNEMWLQQNWEIPTHWNRRRDRAYIRYAARGDQALLINGSLVARGTEAKGDRLQMYDVSHYLHPGINQVTLHLSDSLQPQPLTERFWPVSGFLDGWAEVKGEVAAPIQTNEQWQALADSPFEPPLESPLQGDRLAAYPTVASSSPQSAVLLGPLKPKSVTHQFEGFPHMQDNIQFLLYQLIGWAFGIAVTAGLAGIIGAFWLKQRDSVVTALLAGSEPLLPSFFFLLGIILLKHRHAEGVPNIWFAQAETPAITLLVAVMVQLLTLIWLHWRVKHSTLGGTSLTRRLGVYLGLGVSGYLTLALTTAGSLPFLGWLVLSLILVMLLLARWSVIERLTQRWLINIHQGPIWRQRLALGTIVAVGFALRMYRLDYIDLDSDENTSYDATQGILKTGIPIATSGIWYTRGPVFHYLLAGWLRILGDSVYNARFFSVIWGTATLVVVFYLTRLITGRTWIALVATALLAIDPWQLWYSRFIRFYQLVQFTTLLGLWAFIRGFIDNAGRRYQYAFFVLMTLTLLIQEVSVTLLPGILVGYLCLARPFRLREDWRLLLGGGLMMGIFAFDIIFFKIKCLTPWVALSSSTSSYLTPHLLNVTGFFSNFFIGPGRLHILYSLFFFAGFAFFLGRRRGRVLFCFSYVLINLLVLTLLTYQIAERYAYGIYPLFIILSLYSAITLVQAAVKKLNARTTVGALPIGALATIGLSLLLVSNLEVGRIAQGYDYAIGRRNTQAFEYIRDHRQPGDVVISPTPSFGPPTLGGVDYFLLGTWYFDATYWRDGRLLDRWGGGVIVSNIDQFEQVLETTSRVWIHVDDARQSRLSAQMLEYIQTLGKPVYDTFGASVRLWQPEDGIFPQQPSQGKDLGAY